MEGQLFSGTVNILEKYTDYNDFMTKSIDWGSVWILSGKICQLPLNSSFFAKPGDLVDQNSVLSQIKWSLPTKSFLDTNSILHYKGNKGTDNLSYIQKYSRKKSNSTQNKWFHQNTIQNLKRLFNNKFRAGNKLSSINYNILASRQKNVYYYPVGYLLNKKLPKKVLTKSNFAGSQTSLRFVSSSLDKGNEAKRSLLNLFLSKNKKWYEYLLSENRPKNYTNDVKSYTKVSVENLALLKNGETNIVGSYSKNIFKTAKRGIFEKVGFFEGEVIKSKIPFNYSKGIEKRSGKRAKKLENKININFPLLSLSIENIFYKKIGYFFLFKKSFNQFSFIKAAFSKKKKEHSFFTTKIIVSLPIENSNIKVKKEIVRSYIVSETGNWLIKALQATKIDFFSRKKISKDERLQKKVEPPIQKKPLVSPFFDNDTFFVPNLLECRNNMSTKKIGNLQSNNILSSPLVGWFPKSYLMPTGGICIYILTHDFFSHFGEKPYSIKSNKLARIFWVNQKCTNISISKLYCRTEFKKKGLFFNYNQKNLSREFKLSNKYPIVSSRRAIPDFKGFFQNSFETSKIKPISFAKKISFLKVLSKSKTKIKIKSYLNMEKNKMKSLIFKNLISYCKSKREKIQIYKQNSFQKNLNRNSIYKTLVYKPKNLVKALSLHKKFFFPGQKIVDDLIFDNQFIYVECIPESLLPSLSRSIPEKFSLFNLKKIVQNKISIWCGIIHNQNGWASDMTKKWLYLKGKNYNTKAFVLCISRVNEYPLYRANTYKKILYKLQKSSKKEHHLDTNFLNKQEQSLKLLDKFPTTDLVLNLKLKGIKKDVFDNFHWSSSENSLNESQIDFFHYCLNSFFVSKSFQKRSASSPILPDKKMLKKSRKKAYFSLINFRHKYINSISSSKNSVIKQINNKNSFLSGINIIPTKTNFQNFFCLEFLSTNSLQLLELELVGTQKNSLNHNNKVSRILVFDFFDKARKYINQKIQIDSSLPVFSTMVQNQNFKSIKFRTYLSSSLILAKKVQSNHFKKAFLYFVERQETNQKLFSDSENVKGKVYRKEKEKVTRKGMGKKGKKLEVKPNFELKDQNIFYYNSRRQKVDSFNIKKALKKKVLKKKLEKEFNLASLNYSKGLFTAMTFRHKKIKFYFNFYQAGTLFFRKKQILAPLNYFDKNTVDHSEIKELFGASSKRNYSSKSSDLLFSYFYDLMSDTSQGIIMPFSHSFSSSFALISSVFRQPCLDIFFTQEVSFGYSENLTVIFPRAFSPTFFPEKAGKKVEKNLGKSMGLDSRICFKKNSFNEQREIALTSYLSAFIGEILRHDNYYWSQNTQKNRYLILTKKDQISFSPFSNNPKNQIYLGEFVNKGYLKITDKSFSSNSGLIIHFNQSTITLRKAQSFFLSPNCIFHYSHGDLVEKNKPILSLPYEQLKTGDIVQGIPKVEQLLEARSTFKGKEEEDNLHKLLKYVFERYRLKFNLKISVRKSFSFIQLILVNSVQRIYRSEGVSISDKHLEVIVKQMTSKVQITSRGDSSFFRGEYIDLYIVETWNALHPQLKKICYKPILLGISRSSLEVNSFLSAASFQHTKKVLSRSAFKTNIDFLNGLKENVIIGNLISAGTGNLTN